jgi:hypothetical protein
LAGHCEQLCDLPVALDPQGIGAKHGRQFSDGGFAISGCVKRCRPPQKHVAGWGKLQRACVKQSGIESGLLRYPGEAMGYRGIVRRQARCFVECFKSPTMLIEGAVEQTNPLP